MTSMTIGNPSTFAIESSITQAFAAPSLLALSFFVIHVGGSSYGIRSENATMLACSFDSVQRRISRRGMHRDPFNSETDAAKIVDAVRASWYGEDIKNQNFFGKSREEFNDALVLNEIFWAPDGDEAFDDGGHVLQYDAGGKVRLIAFKNTKLQDDVTSTLADIWMSADEFYGLLDKWQSNFELEWASVPKMLPGGIS